MNNKILLGIITATVILLGSVNYVAADNTKDIDTKIVFNNIKEDFKEYVKEDLSEKPNMREKIDQVKEQYSSDLDIALSTIGEKYGKNYIELSLEYKNILKDIIIKNEFKHVVIQN